MTGKIGPLSERQLLHRVNAPLLCINELPRYWIILILTQMKKWVFIGTEGFLMWTTKLNLESTLTLLDPAHMSTFFS